MKVALVSDCYLPRLGGIEVQVADLAGHLRAAGQEVAVLTATPGAAEQGVTRLLPPVPLPAPVNPWAGPALRAALGRADVAHVHLGVLAPFAGQAVEVALELGLPTVVTWHSILGPAEHALRWGGRWRRWVDAGARPTAVGSTLAGQLQRVVGDRVPVRVLHNGIDPAVWAGGPPAPATGPVRLTSAIRFARRRRPLALLALLETLRDRVPGAVELDVLLAGDGPLLGAARRRVRRRGMDGWVRLPGRLSRPELAARYHLSHLYLTSSRTESFGIAALEARTAGVPVAGLAEGGLGEFVTDGVGGVLARDDDDLVERVAPLLADRAGLASMAERLRTSLPPQVWARVVPATLAAYQEAVAARAARAGR